MNPDRWAQVSRLYHEAAARPAADRAAFLADACGGDQPLRHEVESLLAQAPSADRFLEEPALAVAGSIVGEESEASLIGRRLGVYHVQALLGAGGMGEVYRARDTRLGRDVALKILPREFTTDTERLTRFEREARMLASLNHPHIATIYGIEEVGDVRALVLELVDGPTLADRLVRGPVPITEAVAIARQIAEALETTHERGIVHRDLKPANIKVTPDGVVKVLDFGLAKAAAGDGSGDLSRLSTVTIESTRDGIILGTAAYMSPEQARGQRVDKRTDIWAFGCVLYEVLTGSAAFAAETLSDTIAKILEREPNWHALPEKTPPGICRLLLRCLEKDTRRRLHDIADARIELEEALAEPARTSHSQVTQSAPQRRGRVWIGLAALITLIATVTLVRPPVRVTPLWFSVIPLEGKLSAPPVLAVSPDGKHMVLGVENASGKDSLWVRSFDSPHLRELPGTQGGQLPFWSPDSRSIAFFSDGKLQRVELDGGIPQVLTQAPNPRGGTWGSQGTIVFAPSVGGGGLLSISASGGTATALKVPGASSSPWPAFLPDGNHFLYLGGTSDRSELYVGSLDSLETKRIGDIASKVEYANGYVFYGKDADLFAQPFDLGRLELTGQATRVASGLGWTFGDVRSRAFSVSATGTLAFSSLAFFPITQLTWFDRSGQRLETAGDPAEYYGFAAAPDGKKVVLEKFNRQRGGPDLWLLELAAGIPSRLTLEDIAPTPVWAADSERIAYYTAAANYQGFKLVALSSGKSEPLLQPSPPGPHFLQSWSRDGRFLLSSSSVDGIQSDLWMLRLEGDGTMVPFLQTPFNESFGRISPDAHWIAYSSDSSGRNEVYVESFPQPGHKKPISRDGGDWPEWRSDGKELYYLEPTSGHRGKLMAAQVEATASAFAASRSEPLFETPAIGDNPRRGQYAPFGAGDRFLLNTLAEETTPRTITVIVNLPALVKQQVP